jgi:hypothetical protein
MRRKCRRFSDLSRNFNKPPRLKYRDRFLDFLGCSMPRLSNSTKAVPANSYLTGRDRLVRISTMTKNQALRPLPFSLLNLAGMSIVGFQKIAFSGSRFFAEPMCS